MEAKHIEIPLFGGTESPLFSLTLKHTKESILQYGNLEYSEVEDAIGFINVNRSYSTISSEIARKLKLDTLPESIKKPFVIKGGIELNGYELVFAFNHYDKEFFIKHRFLVEDIDDIPKQANVHFGIEMDLFWDFKHDMVNRILKIDFKIL